MIVHGDCIEAMRGMDEASVDAVVTDPPYHLSFMGRAWDHAPSPRESQAMHEAWATEVLRVLKPSGHLLAFGGTRTSHRLTCAVEDAGFDLKDCIAWHYRNNSVPKGRGLRPAWEPILLAVHHGWPLALQVDAAREPWREGEQEAVEARVAPNTRLAGTNLGTIGWSRRRLTVTAKGGRWPTNLKEAPKPKGGSAEHRSAGGHPTLKPLALMRWLVRLVTPPGGTVLDPFAGSGSTGIACVLEGLDFLGIEREQEYVEISRARIAHWQAVKDSELLTLVA